MDSVKKKPPMPIKVPRKPAPPRTAEQDAALDDFFAEVRPEGFSDQELEDAERVWRRTLEP
ncbi:MAG: hypothetical protein AAF938_24115 [Myxococcota bacterium]